MSYPCVSTPVRIWFEYVFNSFLSKMLGHWNFLVTFKNAVSCLYTLNVTVQTRLKVEAIHADMTTCVSSNTAAELTQALHS